MNRILVDQVSCSFNELEHIFSFLLQRDGSFISGRGTSPICFEVEEGDDQVLYSLPLVGVKKEDIQVTVDDSNLVVQWKKKDRKKAKSTSILRRLISLSQKADLEGITAEFENGLLEVIVPLKVTEISIPIK